MRVIAMLKRLLLAGPEDGSWAGAAWAARLVSGCVFVAFGLAKFVNHSSEVASFQSYGLPSPDTFVYVIGAVEVVGGLLLIAGLATRAVAVVLAGNMVGAITVSGIGEGEILSLTLAPALLLLMLLLIALGPGQHAFDRRLRLRWLGPLALILAGLALAGCGGGGGSPDVSVSSPQSSHSGADAERGGTRPTDESAKQGSSRAAVEGGVTIATEDTQFGTILFDGDRQAIYLFEKESSDRSECYGDCAVAWPPVLTKGDPQGDGAVSSKLLGTTARKDGTTQVTYNGHPLYYYEVDPRGEVLCQDVVEFGGRWLVVDPQGSAVQ